MALAGSAANPVQVPHGWTIIDVGGPKIYAVIDVQFTSGGGGVPHPPDSLADYAFSIVVRGHSDNPDIGDIVRAAIGADPRGSSFDRQWDAPEFLPAPNDTTPTPDYPSYWNSNPPPSSGVWLAVPEDQELRDFSHYYSFFEDGMMSNDVQDGHGTGEGQMICYCIINVGKLMSDFQLAHLYIDINLVPKLDPGLDGQAFFTVYRGGVLKGGTVGLTRTGTVIDDTQHFISDPALTVPALLGTFVYPPL